jgi:hypothetical protein
MACIAAPLNRIYFMSKHSLISIETELRKRWKYPYVWLQKQNNQWDSYTNFIYNTLNWEELIVRIELSRKQYSLNEKVLFNYAINRWYNFWSSVAIEQIFSEIDGIEPVPNVRDREVDFKLFGINFDHKTSVFPKHVKNDLIYAQTDKPKLIDWFYRNQSAQKRHHLKNRLFIVVYNNNGEHWKLKAELDLIKTQIHKYVANFREEQLYSFTFAKGTIIYSDIIWVTK